MKLFFLLLLFPLVSFARWATPQEYDFSMKGDMIFDVKKDGTYSVEYYTEYEVLKASAIDSLSVYNDLYNPQIGNIVFQEAWVINDGKKIDLPATGLTETITPPKSVFDEVTKITFKFPDVKVGSKLGIRYTLKVNKPLIDNHFSYSHYFGIDGIWLKEGSVTVKSELPLDVATIDPNKLLKTERLKKKQEEVKVSVVRPIMQKVVEEYGVYTPEVTSIAYFSTSKNLDLVRRQLQSRFDISLNSTPTPEMLSTVAQAKSKLELQEQINHLLIFLKSRLKYAGEWKTIKGSFTPRQMTDIFKSKTADDKELASALVIMLRKLGYSASVALVERSDPTLAGLRQMKIPVMNLFNHAIVHLSANGETYWVDPSELSPFGYNLSDLMTSKEALVLNESGELQKIPAINPDPSSTTIFNSYNLENENDVQVSGKITFTGSAAQTIRSSYLANPSDPQFKAKLVSKMASYQKVLSHKMAPFQMDNLDLKQLVFSADFKADKIVGKDPKGAFIFIPNFEDPIRPFLMSFEKWELNLYLGEPTTFKREYAYKNVTLTGESTFKSCEINNKWLHVKRSQNSMNKVLTITDQVTIKVPILTNSDLRSQEFLQFQNQLRPCLYPGRFYYKK